MREPGAQGAPEETSRWETAAALALTAMVAALHAIRMLHAGGLWRDEAGAARLAAMPTLREVFGLFPHEAFPLLFPGTVRAYTFLTGGGDQALRTFGLVVGLAVVGILWLNARAARMVPLLSLALLGLDVPFLIYGDSVRGYGLGSALILLTFGLLARALGEPGRDPGTPAVLAAFTAVAGVQVVLSNAALLGALCAAAIAVAARRRRWRLAAWVAGSGAVAALSLLPYAGPLAEARRQWSIIVTYPTRVSQVWHAFIETLGERPVQLLWLVLVLAALAVLARELARRPADPEPGRSDAALFAALVIPCALVANGAFLKTLSYRPRPWYFLPLIALLAGALDLALAAMPRSGERRALLLRLAVVALLACGQALPLMKSLTLRQTNVDLVAREVARAAAPQDLVVVSSWFEGVSFNRYYTGPARWLTLPDLPDHRIHRYDLLKVRMASLHPIDDVLAAVAATLRSGHRVWLVGGARWPKPGEAVAVLPPAPRSSEGWHDWPYTGSWSRQLGAFLESHAGHLATVAVPAGDPVNELENLPLVVAEGWTG